MAEMINLDAMIPESRQVQFKGKVYELSPSTVEMYLTVTRQKRNYRNAETEEQMIQQGLALVELSCPSIPKDELMKLPVKAIMSLINAVTEMMDVQAGEDAPKDEVGTTQTEDGSSNLE